MLLLDSEYLKPLASRLELMLTVFWLANGVRAEYFRVYIHPTCSGNFYMAPVDRFLKEFGVKSAQIC